MGVYDFEEMEESNDTEKRTLAEILELDKPSLEEEKISEIENTDPTIREGVWYDENLPYFRLFKATVVMLILSLYLLSQHYIKTWSF